MSRATAYRKLLLAAALSAVGCGVHAQDAEQQARTGAVTDGMSMAVWPLVGSAAAAETSPVCC